jgi:3-oxoacyl-[acyl-carrier protein] reductase
MDLGLAGRVALVTAGSRGLGRAAAQAFAEEGVNVAICGRTPETVATAEKELAACGVDVLGLVEDVGDSGAAGRIVGAVLERFGRIDVLVGNTGGPPPGHVLDISDDQLAEALDAHIMAMVRLTRAVVAPMQTAGWGRICYVTATGVHEPLPGHAVSACVRTGLWAWAKAASHDLIGHGVTVNTLCPGAHDTDRMKEIDFPGPRGRPEDFGKLVAMLCSAPAGFVTGTALCVDGGATLALL